MAKKLILALLTVLLSYFIYTLVLLLDLDSPIQYHNNEKCTRLEIPMPVEDLALYKNFIIGATSDSIQTFYKHLSAAKAKPGYLIAIEKSSKAIQKVKMLNFPETFQMNAHGVKIFNENILYVISHCYSKGGERIFIFELEVVEDQVQATYKKSYYFEGDHAMYNSLALVDENHFYLTQWLPFPDQEEGRDNSQFTGLYRILTSIYRTVIPIKFCEVLPGDQVKCTAKALGNMPNGVVYNKGKLFVADSCDKSIRIYKVLSNFDLESEGKVQINHSIDNIWLHGDELIGAGVARVWDYIAFSDAVKKDKTPGKVPGGVVRVYQENNTWKVEQIVVQDLVDLISSAVITNEIVISSVIDPALVICPLNKK